MNSGNMNSGHFNTDEPTVRMFNKDTGLKRNEILIPDFMLGLNITEWIMESKMTPKEKKENPSFYIEQGYLKIFEYKEAWKKLWKTATKTQINEVKKLPNFDKNIFKEITGITIK